MTDIIKKETMTSREIAELTGKQHSNVCRDIKSLNKSYDKLGELKVELSYYLTEQNKKVIEYQLNKSQSLDLALGYSQELRIKLRKKWEELELNIKPQSKLEWIELALEQEKKVLQLEESNEVLQIELDEHQAWYSVKRVIIMGHFNHKDASKLWRPLKQWHIENDMQIKGIFDANYGEVKTYHKNAWKAVHNIDLR